MLFSPSCKQWKCPKTEGWISILFRVFCQAVLPTARAFYPRCVSSWGSLGDTTKQDFKSVLSAKKYVRSPNFTRRQILLFDSVTCWTSKITKSSSICCTWWYITSNQFSSLLVVQRRYRIKNRKSRTTCHGNEKHGFANIILQYLF